MFHTLLCRRERMARHRERHLSRASMFRALCWLQHGVAGGCKAELLMRLSAMAGAPSRPASKLAMASPFNGHSDGTLKQEAPLHSQALLESHGWAQFLLAAQSYLSSLAFFGEGMLSPLILPTHCVSCGPDHNSSGYRHSFRWTCQKASGSSYVSEQGHSIQSPTKSICKSIYREVIFSLNRSHIETLKQSLQK